MTAIREQIATLLDARLQAIADAHGGEYERDPSGDPTGWPAISLDDEGQDPSDEESGVTRYAMSVAIEVYSEGSSGMAVSRELNELHAEIVPAIMTPGAPPFGGLVERVEEGQLKRFTAPLASKPRKGFRQRFTIIFTTRRGDPASQ
nr:hypothetical protein [Sphingomonas sp. Y57]